MNPDLKSYDVNVNIASGPMTLKISKVTLDPAYQKDTYSNKLNAVILDAVSENTSIDTVRWYPDQATSVLNTKEQTKASFQSDRLGGEYIGKVIKSGKIVFEVKSSLSDVSSVTLKVSGPSNDKIIRLGEDKTTEIILK